MQVSALNYILKSRLFWKSYSVKLLVDILTFQNVYKCLPCLRNIRLIDPIIDRISQSFNLCGTC